MQPLPPAGILLCHLVADSRCHRFRHSHVVALPTLGPEALAHDMAAGMAMSAGGLLVPASAQAQETPRRGGHLPVAGHSSSANDTLDPARFSLSTDFIRGHMVYNNLTRLDDQAQPIPDLAETFEPGDDPSVWIFQLREGVTFHDGKALSTDDVIFSLMRHADESVGSAASGRGYRRRHRPFARHG